MNPSVSNFYRAEQDQEQEQDLKLEVELKLCYGHKPQL